MEELENKGSDPLPCPNKFIGVQVQIQKFSKHLQLVFAIPVPKIKNSDKPDSLDIILSGIKEP